MSTEDPAAPTLYAKHPIGAVFASVHDETDDDHTGRPRVTPAGSLWEVAAIDRYRYGATGAHPAGSVCAYTLNCPTSGATIVAYTPIAGEPFGHHRDEMEGFLPIDLPGQTWPTLRLQLRALCEVKDAIMEAWDDKPVASETIDAITNEVRKAGILPDRF